MTRFTPSRSTHTETRFNEPTTTDDKETAAVGHTPARTGSVPEMTNGRPSPWREVAVVAWLLWIYDAVDNLTQVHVAEAIGHAAGILHLERALHIGLELPLNQALSSHRVLALVVADYYDNAHFVVTFAVLGWLWLFKPGHYSDLRQSLVLINLIGFAVFLVYPMAPPRMLPGFIDTVAATHALGSWHSGALASDANQYAAMPSLHLAWAVWSCIAVRSTTRWLPARTVAAGYPLLTAFAVIATANHLITDSLFGVATALVAVRANRPLAQASSAIRRALSVH